MAVEFTLHISHGIRVTDDTAATCTLHTSQGSIILLCMPIIAGMFTPNTSYCSSFYTACVTRCSIVIATAAVAVVAANIVYYIVVAAAVVTATKEVVVLVVTAVVIATAEVLVVVAAVVITTVVVVVAVVVVVDAATVTAQCVCGWKGG